ncbi:MAG: hypothetical protein KIG60_05820 [Caryophanon sp.]|nr:hypothetical protein [Caryophanon sp.]
MKVNYAYVVLLALLCVIAFPVQPASAASVQGEFVEAVYRDTVDAKGNVTGQELSQVTLRASDGSERTYFMNALASLYINNTPTNIQGFKAGMQVTASVTLRRITEMRGTSVDPSNEDANFGEANTSTAGQINANGRSLSGIVTEIDPYGMFMTVKTDQGRETQYFLNNDTKYFKNSNQTTLAGLFIGDRVQLNFSSATSSTVTRVTMSDVGKKVSGIYKARLQVFSGATNRLTVRNEEQFKNWDFQQMNGSRLKAYKTTSQTTYYVGGMKIAKNQLSNYRGSELYYVTTNTFGQEVIEKVVVLSMRERSFEAPIVSVDTANNYMRFDLETLKFLYYHGGTILVRNGRLIEETSLIGQGKAFALTQPQGNTEVANMIYTTSKGFTSANLADHELYFGELYYGGDLNDYNIELNDAVKLTDNYWQVTNEPIVDLKFTNTTAAYDDLEGNVLPFDAETELHAYEGYYGYFYVQDGIIDTVYFIDPSARNSEQIVTGVVDRVNERTGQFDVHSLNEWVGDNWQGIGGDLQTTLDKAVIIKDGKNISASQITAGDHVYMLLDADSEPHVVLIN